MCTCVCMWRSEVDAPYLPRGLSINLEITGSITQSGQQAAAGGSSSLCLLIAGLSGMCSVFLRVHWGPELASLWLHSKHLTNWVTPQHWHFFFNISRRQKAMLSHSLLNNNHIEDCNGVCWSNCFTERIYSTHETICVRGYSFAEWGWIFFSKIDSAQPSYSQGLNFLRIISLLPERIS